MRALRAFAQVARLGSVSRAAAALGISQPAVTQHLQALALEHEVVLLERSGRRLVPTAAGDVLLALARPLVDGVEGLGDALQARLRAQAPAGVAVAAGVVALRALLPAALGALDPGARAAVAVRHAGGAAALDLVRDGSVDVAVGSWLDVPGDIAFNTAWSSPARLVVPARHPLVEGGAIEPRDIARHPLVLPGLRNTTRQLVDLAFARAGIPMPVPREAGSWDATLQLVALGQGVTVSNALALRGREDPRLAVLPLSDAFPPRPYGMATRRGRTPPAAVRAFLAALPPPG